jgi:hypothetical protein
VAVHKCSKANGGVGGTCVVVESQSDRGQGSPWLPAGLACVSIPGSVGTAPVAALEYLLGLLPLGGTGRDQDLSLQT